MKISVPRGTCDVLPANSYKRAYIENAAREISSLFGYKEIRTPVFEHTELFCRGIGSGSDIVRKEMYTFEDKKGRSLTLRPEGTATVMRSIVENNLCQTGYAKLFYIGPFFRYERPQEGRYRQFHQFGLEAAGVDSPLLDAEIIHAACSFFGKLGLENLTVQLNSLGCPECRPAYREALVSFFESKKDDLCGDCKERLAINPLRVLDCKNAACRAIAADAPVMLDYLCPECSNHFDIVKKALEVYGINYAVNRKIVRGLDYYTRTVFEVVSDQLGAQDAICGGGRYNNLAEEIGGKSIPAVGFAAGIERTAALMEKRGCSFGKEPAPEVFVVPFEESCVMKAAEVLGRLRNSGISSDLTYSKKNIKKIFRDIAEAGAAYAYIIGPDEMAAGKISVKSMKDKSQAEINDSEAVEFILKGRC